MCLLVSKGAYSEQLASALDWVLPLGPGDFPQELQDSWACIQRTMEQCPSVQITGCPPHRDTLSISRSPKRKSEFAQALLEIYRATLSGKT
ncbi:hypothetical protein C8N36_10672 [Pelagimonas varians]|uniref:Uncharacterized protein n=1 Tax=Pelagimonas varians TaxID=696760 RepID=A0A238K4J3_9RHOB|nr:hypothetical protein C8N36_10672 [Pelagimonas varians]SMX37841.1 hypothetical protein PEV8663_01218 [Pelagimonas varians]